MSKKALAVITVARIALKTIKTPETLTFIML